MIAFLAHFLIVLAAWTVTIKFLFPIAYALGEGVPIGTHIYWDLWWIIHLWLAWALLRWQPYTYALALGVSTVEILIIATKLVLFLSDLDHLDHQLVHQQAVRARLLRPDAAVFGHPPAA